MSPRRRRTRSRRRCRNRRRRPHRRPRPPWWRPTRPAPCRRPTGRCCSRCRSRKPGRRSSPCRRRGPRPPVEKPPPAVAHPQPQRPVPPPPSATSVQQPAPSPLVAPRRRRSRRPWRGTQDTPTPPSSPFVNPADEHARATAEQNYLWQVMSKLRGYRYHADVPVTGGPHRGAGHRSRATADCSTRRSCARAASPRWTRACSPASARVRPMRRCRRRSRAQARASGCRWSRCRTSGDV